MKRRSWFTVSPCPPGCGPRIGAARRAPYCRNRACAAAPQPLHGEPAPEADSNALSRHCRRAPPAHEHTDFNHPEKRLTVESTRRTATLTRPMNTHDFQMTHSTLRLIERHVFYGGMPWFC